MRHVLSSVAALLALSTARFALADPTVSDRGGELQAAAADPETPTPAWREQRPAREWDSSALGTAAAIFPGALVHGAGHLVMGESRTGLRLLALEGAGLGLLATGFVPIVLSGASRRLVGPGAALSVVGAGLFAVSFLADIYGLVAPEGGVGAPLRVAPTLQTAVGYRYVYDRAFSYRHFMVQEIDYRTGAWRLHPSAWFALDDTNSRLRGHVAYRLTGPLPSGNAPSRDGSFLDLEAALTRHAFTGERFATTTGEVAVAGRLDMAHIGPSLRGSFAEMSVGWALQAYSYALRGTTADLGELLLARFGYGVYVGFPGSPRGEIALYYDHRHDDFVAGLKLPGLGSGVIGHFGAEARFFLTSQWGVAAEAAVGSAYLTGISILFRHGEPL
ncbi:MAG TPA: hypothetical protein VK550_32345 [Polyangiaceae bacterium]|nr:hypothetical protein [Polyangiaceae bacterium]